MKHKSDLIIEKGDKKDYSKLTEVSGSVYVRQGATFTAPALTKSGYVDVQEGATFTAPALTKSGYVYVQEGATFTAPLLAERLFKIGYTILSDLYTKRGGVFPVGHYIEVTAKDVEYLRKLKPLIERKRVNMAHWHQNENWKNQDIDKAISECTTTHCVAGWLQIFEKDKYNDLTAEDAGMKISPALSKFFHSDEKTIKNIINTLLPN